MDIEISHLLTKLSSIKDDAMKMSITSGYDFTTKCKSCDSNHVDVISMWPKFGSSSISAREDYYLFVKILLKEVGLLYQTGFSLLY